MESWMVVWNINFVFPWLLGMSSSQLTNSIIFQRGGPTTNQKVSFILMSYGPFPVFFPMISGPSLLLWQRRRWGCPSTKGYPIAGWFLLGEIPSRNGWLGGTPISGKHHVTTMFPLYSHWFLLTSSAVVFFLYKWCSRYDWWFVLADVYSHQLPRWIPWISMKNHIKHTHWLMRKKKKKKNFMPSLFYQHLVPICPHYIIVGFLEDQVV